MYILYVPEGVAGDFLEHLLGVMGNVSEYSDREPEEDEMVVVLDKMSRMLQVQHNITSEMDAGETKTIKVHIAARYADGSVEFTTPRTCEVFSPPHASCEDANVYLVVSFVAPGKREMVASWDFDHCVWCIPDWAIPSGWSDEA